jgi:hypothetical protein
MTVDVLLKKSFSGASENGLTFHWLRCAYGELLDDAVISAVRLVYYPDVLSASLKPWDRVASEVARSRHVFQKKRLSNEKSCLIGLPLPKRVHVTFRQSFDEQSCEGQTFEWLLYLYKGEVEEAIARAVRLVYLPSALAWLPDKSGIAADMSARSGYLFEQMMGDAILKAGPSDLHFNVAPIDIPVLVNAPSSKSADIKASCEPDPSSADELDDFDDDYVPIEYDLDFCK